MEANNCRHVGDKPIQAYNVGCMKPWIDYEPRCLKEIIEKHNNQKSDEKMRAFKELVATRYEAKKYLPDDFDSDAELEAARKERYGSID